MNKQNKIIVGVVALILALTVGYAIFSQSLNISGTAKASANFGLIFEESTKDPTCQGYSGGEKCKMADVAEILEDGRTLKISIDKLLYPTAYVKIPVLVKNVGTVDAVLESIQITEPETSDIVVKYSIIENDTKYSMVDGKVENGTIIKPGDDNRKEIEVEISWNKDSETSEPIEVNFNMTMNYKQVTNAVVTTTGSSELMFPEVSGKLGDNVSFKYYKVGSNEEYGIAITGTGDMYDGLLDNEEYSYCEEYNFWDSTECTLISEISSKVFPKLDIKYSSDKVKQVFKKYLTEFIGGGTIENLYKCSDEEFKEYILSKNSFSDAEANEILLLINSIPKIKSFTIENGITLFRGGLFLGITTQEIVLPNTITKVSSDSQLFLVNKIDRISLEPGVKTIYSGVLSFGDMTNIGDIIIPEGVETIKAGAIIMPDNELTLTIPSTVKTIENGAISSYNSSIIVNKTGKAFDWSGILTGTSGTAFETGTVEYNGNTITIIK